MATRLTADQMRYREISEKAFQAQVSALAQLLGWHSLHIRAAAQMSSDRTKINRYTTPIQGSLGKGWPDLVLVHEKYGRLIFAELKAEVGRISEDQQRVLGVLRAISNEVYVWRPSQIDEIEGLLRRRSFVKPRLDNALPTD